MRAMTAVIMLQSLVFGDGGATALGTNVLVRAVVPIAVAVGVRALAMRAGVERHARTTAGVAAVLSVPAGTLALVALYAVGGAGSVDAAAMAASMTGVHLLIGLGEALITVGVLSAVMFFAPGVAERDARVSSATAPRRAVVTLSGAALVFSTALAAIAASTPDGLESVALAYSLPSGDTVIAGLPLLSDYGAAAGTSLLLVGAIGVLAAGLLTSGLSAPLLRREADARA
ncbi:energy-coupling factor ABC transporter permease [Microbacterium sp. C7(2022)]|nr:energy-coupling factor ABC transporter permease [Microbacterium sp. C7(2022)]